MAEVSSAGSFVTAVLETAGYVSQYYFLDWFGEFFFNAGQLLYVYACIGGLISVALFADFRMARYLILGPWLFFFCTFYTVETDGAVWRIGNDGRIHMRDSTDPGADDANQAADEIHAIVTQNGVRELADTRRGSPPARDPVRVSGVFYIYTNTINNIVAEFVDLVAQIREQLENDDRILFNSIRGQAMEMVLSASTSDRQLVNMIQEDLLGTACEGKYSMAVAASPHRLQQESIDTAQEVYDLELATHGATERVRQMELALQKRRDEKAAIEQMVEDKGQLRFKPSLDMLAFMGMHLPASGSAYSTGTQRALNNWLATQTAVPGMPTTSLGMDAIKGRVTLSCEDAYYVVMDAIMEDAESQWGSYVEEGLFPDDVPDDVRDWGEEELCRSLAIKFGGNPAAMAAAGGCDIVRVYGIFLLRNAIAQSAMSKSVQRMKNRMGALRPVAYHNRNYARPTEQNGDRYFVKNHKIQTRNINGKDVDGMVFRNTTKNRDEWKPMNEITHIGNGRGPMQMLEIAQSYQTRQLRQQLYSYTLKIPYIQGVILYLLGATYPFFCLCLLIPGKAVTWLQLPFYWLWAKSWDIGFAAAMVLENVLWNLFPNTDLYDYSDTAILDMPDLDNLLQDAFKADFTYDVHAYYLMMSICMMSVPAISGYVVLKGKHQALASFASKAGGLAKGGGEEIGGVYGNYTINNMMQQGKILSGAAYGSAILSMRDQLKNPAAIAMGGRPGNPTGGMGDAGSGTAGAMSGATDMGAMRGLSAMVAASGGSAKNLAKGAEGLLDTTSTLMAKQMDFAAKKARMDDPVYGRYGMYRMMAEGAASSVDGNLGFEINDAVEQPEKVIQSGQDLFIAQLGALRTAQKDLQAAFFKANPTKKPLGWAMTIKEGKDVKSLFDTAFKTVEDPKVGEGLTLNLPVKALTDEQIASIENGLLKGSDWFNSWLSEASPETFGGLTGQEALQTYYFQRILQLKPGDMERARRAGPVSKSYMPEGYKMLTKMIFDEHTYRRQFEKN